LIDAFVELMAEKAFDTISISEITQRATVNRATFYAHFADKHVLAETFIREGFEKTIANHVSGEEHTINEFLCRLFRATAEHRSTVHSECRSKAHSLDEMRKFEASTEVEVNAMLKERIHAWLIERHYADSTPPKGLADLMSSMISSALYAAVVHFNSNRHLKDNGVDVERIVDSIARTLD